jgi:Fe-S oxidoreductase
MQIIAIALTLAITVVGVALVAGAAAQIYRVIRLGAEDATRTDRPVARTGTLLRETVLHTRMLQWSVVGVAHWFVLVGFIFLFTTLVTAYGQVFDPEFALPIVGKSEWFGFLTELIAMATVLGICTLIVIRLANRPSYLGRRSRFAGSTMWQGYYVEGTILAIGVLILAIRGLEGVLSGVDEWELAHAFSYPVTAAFSAASTSTVENLIILLALLKIVVSMAWFVVIARNTTMGVAWHRFTAWFNIFFKREASGGTALGGLQPIRVGGEALDFENLDDLDEDAALGVGKVEDFTWKNILDFTTCTECGRCQSQCPAWNTAKPLSPKLLITNLRDHTYAKAPALLAGDADGASLPSAVIAESERPLVGDAEAGGVIDPDVLWSCTTCGACVQQCPVDIEHVDHIVDMRRYQVLIETEYPKELNGLFKNLEKAGNPWGVNASKRMDWAAELDFPVPQVGVDVESLDEVEWLFWVGCAGAFEDRAKKTTQAVAELLHIAGVSFAVLGDSETCTGDPARRSGNEFLYQQLAMENREVFTETKATRVVATCAHCFNTLANEYHDMGIELEVKHHTQLLNALVREGRLVPVADPAASVAGAAIPSPTGSDAAGSRGRGTVTYHDPCYLGRHNEVYSPPRELLMGTGLALAEMPRNSQRSFCCGAGGARMWMEERIGTRINADRTEEALETGADTIAVACPFCRVMLSDGLTAAQHDGRGEGVEVLDVSQLLLQAVKREPAVSVGVPREDVS